MQHPWRFWSTSIKLKREKLHYRCKTSFHTGKHANDAQILLCIILTVPPTGIDKMWILGDLFVGESIQQYYMGMQQTDSYSRTHLEVNTFHRRTVHDGSDNPFSRIYNGLIYAMRTMGYIPMILVIVIEDDVIRYADYNDFGVTAMYGRVITYLADEINKAINEFKSILPQKCLREDWPQMLWVMPTTHDHYHQGTNTLRKKFAHEMEAQLRHQPKMHALHVNKLWQSNNVHLVDRYSHRITPLGMANFWKDVDRMVKFVHQHFSDFTTKHTNTQGRRHQRCKDQGRPEYWRAWRPENRPSSTGPRFILPRAD